MSTTPSTWRIDVLPDGRIRTLHHDAVLALLRKLGPVTAERVSDVEFSEADQAWTIAFRLDTAHQDARALLVGDDAAMTRSYTRRADAIQVEVQTITLLPMSYGTLSE